MPSKGFKKRLELIEKNYALLANRENIGGLPEPQPKQREFIESPAKVTIFGGAAGSGKSFSSLLDAAQPHLIKHPDYRCVFFRRTKTMIRAAGGLWDASLELFQPLRARANSNNLTYTFPSGSKIQFSYLDQPKDRLSWLSSNISRICFEELTEFRESDFFFMLSRLRSANPNIETKVKASCNPDPGSWLRSNFINYYLNENGYPDLEKCGRMRYFIRENDRMYWDDTPDKLREKFDRDPTSFLFIPARITDNQKLLDADPGYLNFLKSLHPVERDRFLFGNWVSDFSAGKFIKSSWFMKIDGFERYHKLVRFYDLAATAEDIKRDSFYTAGVKMALRYNPRMAQDEYCIIDADWIRGDYEQVNNFLEDNARKDGINCTIAFEQEPGGSGKRDAENIKDLLSNYIVEAISPQGSKLDRCKPFARTLSQNKVFILPFLKHQEYITQIEKFDGARIPLVTDISDATAGAFNYLSPD